MIYSKEVEEMCPVAQGVHHGCAPIPEEAKWVQAKEVKDISGQTGQDLSSHSCGVGHTGTSNGLNQSLLDDAFLNVQGKLTCTLLRSTPSHTVC